MRRTVLLFCTIFVLIKISIAVQCNTNPCELGGDFNPPNYQCLQATDNVNNVICTCPDGQTTINRRCRICETVNCGLNGICIERSFFEGLFYACGCMNDTINYLNPGPCSGVNPTTTPPGICLNGGFYNVATGTCICPSGFTGRYCEISSGQANCQNVVCANGGVCNPTPSVENGVEMQCTCPAGFAGPNCELIGLFGRCVAGLCKNGGICEERTVGTSVFAFCRCPPGVIGQCCQSRYFSCPLAGIFADSIHCKFGRYFQCTGSSLTTLSCPRGLRYNFMKMQCDSDVTCPM